VAVGAQPSLRAGRWGTRGERFGLVHTPIIADCQGAAGGPPGRLNSQNISSDNPPT
jgi:hypothetical protein